MKMRKILAMVMALALTAALAVGGTLAYLTSKDTVVNTFTVGNVNITMDEAPVDTMGTVIAGDRRDTNDYHLLPGHKYSKDPIVHVTAGSEDSYLFVKLENDLVNIIAHKDANNTTNPVTPAVLTIEEQMAAKGWMAVDSTNKPGVYCYCGAGTTPVKVNAKDNIPVFEYFQISDDADVSTYATQKDSDGKIIANSIDITAYAVQADGFENKTAAEIWTAANFS